MKLTKPHSHLSRVVSLGVFAVCLATADAQPNPYTGPAGPVVAGPGSPFTGPAVGPYLPNAMIPSYFGQGGLLTTTPTAPGFPYGSPGYGGGYGYQPYPVYDFSDGGYLRGIAAIIDAQGRYLTERQNAFVVREQARRARVDTRKMIFDQLLYEREKLPTPEEVRQDTQRQLLARSLNNPPIEEVTSARALNTILAALQAAPPSSEKDGAFALDRETVNRINLTKGDGGGNLGLLRDEGELSWPVAIRTLSPAEEAEPLVRAVSLKTKEAYNQVVSGGTVNPELLGQLREDVRRLSEMVSDNVNDLSFTEYSDARSFLSHFKDALKILGDADAAQFLGGEYMPRAGTVEELVAHMTQKGLRFAPAVNADELGAYSALHQALVRSYHSAVK